MLAPRIATAKSAAKALSLTPARQNARATPAPEEPLLAERSPASSAPVWSFGKIALAVPPPPSIPSALPIARADTLEEREAEHTATGSHPSISTVTSAPGPQAPPLVHQVLRSPGLPLEAAARLPLERRFGHDFSAVRIHADATAAQSARRVNANAYTVGRRIVFDTGRFAPSTIEGQRLLAHELTHTLQQERSQTPVVQRDSKKGDSGTRETVVEVRWSEEEGVFYDRLLAAIGRSKAFYNVESSEFERYGIDQHPLRPLSNALHTEYRQKHSDLKGARVKIRVSAYYNPHHGADEYTIYNPSVTLEPSQPQTKAPATPPTTAPANTSNATGTGAATTPDKKKGSVEATQPAWIVGVLTKDVLDADRKGYGGYEFTVQNSRKGGLVISHQAKISPRHPHASNQADMSEKTAHSDVQTFMDTVLLHDGEYHGLFQRDAKSGSMVFQSFHRTEVYHPPPEVRPSPRRDMSQEQWFEAVTGMPYPQAINRRLAKIGAKLIHDSNPLLLKNLPYTIAGVVVPIGAMKLLTMDLSEAGNLVRIEWQVDEELVAQSTQARASASVTAEQPANALQVGDVVEWDGQPQKVVDIKPGKVITEPYTVEADHPALQGTAANDSYANDIEAARAARAQKTNNANVQKQPQTLQVTGTGDAVGTQVETGNIGAVDARNANTTRMGPKPTAQPRTTAQPQKGNFQQQRDTVVGSSKESPEVHAMNDSKTPGGKMQGVSKAVGNYAHNDVQHWMEGLRVSRDPKAPAQLAELENVTNWPRGVKPNRTVRLNMLDGREGIPDGIDLHIGEVIELKPNTETQWAQRGQYQAQEYADVMNAMKYGGRTDWHPRVVTYDAQALEALLRRWGVIE
jgi:hypothetical protein